MAATELALLCPFLGFILVVAIDYCRVFHLTQTVESAAQNAALYAAGASKPDPDSFASQVSAAQQAALDEGSRLSPPLSASNVNVSVKNNVATATISYSFTTITKIPGFPTTMTVTRTVQMPVLPTNPGYAYVSNVSNDVSGGSNSGGSSGSGGTSGSGNGNNSGCNGLQGLLGRLLNNCDDDDHRGCGRGCSNNGRQCDDDD